MKALLGAHPDDQFFWAASREESIAHVLYSTYFDTILETGRNHYLTIQGEDTPITATLERLEVAGCFAKKVPAHEIKRYITPRTSLVTLSWANPLTGVLHPIQAIVAACQHHGVLLHIDASHVLGKLPIRFDQYPIDFLTFDCGILVRQSVKLGPLICGRVEPDPTDHIKSLLDNLQQNSFEIIRLRDQFERKLLEETDCEIIGRDSERLPGVSAIRFSDVYAELLAFHLHHQGIASKCIPGDPTALSFSTLPDLSALTKTLKKIEPVLL